MTARSLSAAQTDEEFVRVDLNGDKTDEQAIRRLAGSPNVRKVAILGQVGVTDEGLAVLADCVSLTDLVLRAPQSDRRGARACRQAGQSGTPYALTRGADH